MITLRSFDSQDYSSLDAVPNVCNENEIESYNYLKEYISNLESKNSGNSLTVTSTSATDIGLQTDSLDDVNLNSIDFMKIESLLLQNNEESIKNEEDKIKQNKLINVITLPSDQHFNTMSLNFSNCLNKESDDITTTINTNESYTFGKTQCLEKKEIENHDSSAKSCKENGAEMNSSIRKDDSTRYNITSDLKHKINVDNLELSDGQDQIQKCEQCSMTFRYKRHLDRHLEGHEKNNCSHCNEKFARRKHLEVHLFRAHGERIVRHSYLCDVCPKSFRKRALLNRHRAKHSYQNGKVCPECGDMINADTNENEHKKNHCKKKQFKCQQCSQVFSIEQTYLSHIQNHNNYKCPCCDITFASKKKAHEHFKTIHVLKLNEPKSTNEFYFCADCKHKFVKKDDYFRHLESITHLNKVSKDIPIFSCAICSKKLITQKALDQHIRRIHKGAKRFICNMYECTFQCSRKTDLDRHKQLHVEERNIVCEHCGKTFTSVSILKDHVLYIHSKERQFICEKCGKAFKRNSLLKRHKLSHEQHRPFACTQCSTAFKRSHHLTRHMETCHRIKLEKKKKVVKLMKTKEGHLVPVSNKPNTSKANKIKTEKESELISKNKERDNSTTNVNSQPQIRPLLNPEENSECPNLSLELTNSSIVDSIPQVLSLVDVNTGQVLTVEIANNLELLPSNELVDHFETNCNEILNLPDYQDIEFQSNFLNTDQTYYDTNYSEIPLENIEGSFSLVNNNGKMETIENYLSCEFPQFLNI
ncbi:hypothetical protein PUN28_019313 [Cardiocondyla obscurior]|uniref:C2H2-type domain-containing protein n=1 Tax=Cardiocondyla obscurior TaxID=286306 RepID=A0AAW2ECX1_9HYME